MIRRSANHRLLGVGRDQPPARGTQDRLAIEEPTRVKPEHVALQMNENDGRRPGQTERLPSRDRLGADVARDIAIGRTVKLRTIVSQSPQPAVCQAFVDAGVDLSGGHHRGAERTTPAGTHSLRLRYGAFASAGAHRAAPRQRTRLAAPAPRSLWVRHM